MTTYTMIISKIAGFSGRSRIVLVDAMLAGSLLLIPNTYLCFFFLPSPLATSWSGEWTWVALEALSDNLRPLIAMAGLNLFLMGIVLGLRQSLLVPLLRMMQHISTMRASTALQHAHRERLPAMPSMRVIAGEVARFAVLAQEYYRKHQESMSALEEARALIAQISFQQQTILASTNREIITQYRSVLAYAHYLDEHIQQSADDQGLRHDFDDVCESSFNLKLIAGALALLRSNEAPQAAPIPLASIMQQTMLALAPTLDRRAMKLSTAEVDTSIVGRGDPSILAHVLWMMLLGTIRYAAAESTLRMRCLYNRDRTQAIMSIVVSELSPGQLTPSERSAHLDRQMRHLTPHLFAETIRLHANIQLAEMLLGRVAASITVLPLTPYACEICLTLPTAAPDTTSQT